MSMATVTTAAEDEVRTLIEYWIEAGRQKDLDAIMSCYTPDIRAFDVIGGLQFKGAQAYRAHWEACLTYMQGEVILELHDFAVVADGDLAVCHFLMRCGTVDEDGKEQTGATRGTVCCRRESGRWLIVHEHYSAPFEMESGKALLDLQP